MEALFGELVSYLFKFIVMLVCAFFGIMVGKNLRKRKNASLMAKSNEE